MNGPPPLRPTGLVLRRDGSFWHEGVRVTHRRLHAALLRGVRYLEPEGVFVTTLGRFRGRIEVEDTPFFVRSYDPRDGVIALSDASREPLAPATLRLGEGGALRCRVKQRWEARFDRAAQAHLLDSLDVRDGEVLVRIGAGWGRAPGLDADC